VKQWIWQTIEAQPECSSGSEIMKEDAGAQLGGSEHTLRGFGKVKADNVSIREEETVRIQRHIKTAEKRIISTKASGQSRGDLRVRRETVEV